MSPSMKKRKTLRSVTAVGLAVAVVAGMSAIDSSVSAIPTQAPTASGPSSGVDVTVGETVAVTTDQEGNPTSLNVYIVNGQVSGDGSGEVNVATGPDNQSEPQQVSSSPGDVSNFLKFGGSYKGDLPVSVTTEVKVDGQSVDANEGYALSGDVEITYTATNNTSRMQTITFQDIFGETKSKEVNIPVPFGDSFSVTFGDGWDVVDTGIAKAKTTGNGTELAAALILFPMIEGIMGGTTQSLTVKARAQNANLPSATHLAVPIDLATYQGGSLLSLAPMAQDKIIEPAAGVLGETVDDVLLATRMISGYTSGFRKLDADYIDPLVADIEKLKANPNAIARGAIELARALNGLATQLEGDAVAKGEIAGVIVSIANDIGKDVPATIKWLEQVIKKVGPDAADASKALTSFDTMLKKIDIADLNTDLADVDEMCTTVGATATYFGGTAGLIVGKPLFDGAKALDDGIAALPRFSAERKTLNTLKTQLVAQSKDSFSNTLFKYRKQLPPQLASAGKSAACTVVDPLMDKAIPAAAAIEPYLATVSVALGEFAKFAASSEVEEVFKPILGGVALLDKTLDNSCSNAQIIDPIEAAIKKYGIDNLKTLPVIGKLTQEILKNCGVAQVMEFLGDVDLTLADLSKEAAKFIEGTRKDVPLITDDIKKVQNISGIAGRAFDAIPGLGDLVVGKVDAAVLGLDAKGEDALVQISDLVAQLQASLIAMNNRGLAGDGAPYGNSTLASGTDGKISNYASYQMTLREASPYARSWATSLGLAGVFLLLALGLGTFLYRRRINP
jgi:hypothetical protein